MDRLWHPHLQASFSVNRGFFGPGLVVQRDYINSCCGVASQREQVQRIDHVSAKAAQLPRLVLVQLWALWLSLRR